MACQWQKEARRWREEQEAELAEKLEDAKLFATQAHEGQNDKAGLPYILHPMRVSESLAPDKLAQIVGVLHDVMEDCGVRWETLYLRYGAEVAWAVEDLSRRRGETYKAFIERARRNPLARKVKIADIKDNMNRDVLPDDIKWKEGMIANRYLPALKRLEEP